MAPLRDMVKKRTKVKVWGMVFCCTASREVHVDVVDNQSLESFLRGVSEEVVVGQRDKLCGHQAITEGATPAPGMYGQGVR